MTYAVKQDLIDRFGTAELIQLTDREQPRTGAVVDAVLNRALADADAEIDGYIAVRYQVPLGSPPALILRLACDVARYRLYDEHPTEQVRQAYEDAVKLLRDVAANKATLGAGAEALPAPSGGSVQIESGGRVFGRAESF